MADKTLNTIIVLRNDTKEAWEQENSYKLQPGEVGVGYMTVTSGEGTSAVTKTVPIIKVGTDGNTPWKQLPQAEGVFEEDQILTYNFGRHKTSNGYVNAGGKGMTTSEWLLDALSVTEDPDVTPPSFSLSAGTITTDTETREIGSKVTKVAWTGTFNAGSYEFGSKQGNTVYTRDAGTGVTASYAVSSTLGSCANVRSGEVTLTTPFQISSDTATTVGTVTSKCSWVDSPRTPVNNVGAPVEHLTIAAGSESETVTFKVTGYRNGFYFGGATSKTAPGALNSATIRDLPNIYRYIATDDEWKSQNKTGAKYKAGDYKIKVPVGTATVIFACPALSTAVDEDSGERIPFAGVTKVYNNTVNADMTTSFTKTTGVSVDGANESYPEAYNVWTYTPNEAYGIETELTVTLG